MSSLAEIVADGKELCAAVVDVEPDRAPDILVNAALVGYARQHGPRLLAVAEAAVEMRGALAEYMENDDHVYENCEELSYGADDCPLCQSERALAAFDAAAGGQP